MLLVLPGATPVRDVHVSWDVRVLPRTPKEQRLEYTVWDEAKNSWEGDPDSDGKRYPTEGGFSILRQWHTFATGYGKRILHFLRLSFASFMCAVVNHRESALCFLVHLLVLRPYRDFGVCARFFLFPDA